MAFWDRLFGLGRNSLAVNTTSGILSPWAPAPEFGSLIISESLGLDLKSLPLNRDRALNAPGVSDGRNLLVATLSPLPLKALNSEGVPLAVQPTWLYRSDRGTPPSERMMDTVDSLIFYGECMWAVERGVNGQILDAVWVPHERWTYDRYTRTAHFDDKELDPKEYLYFRGRHEGILKTAQNTLRAASKIERATERNAENPIATAVLQYIGDSELDQSEIDYMLTSWRDARLQEGGALGYLPKDVEMRVFGESDPALFLEGRVALRVDIASFMGIPASMIEGSTGDSMTYSTSSGNRNRFYTETLPLYTNAVEARLSADDVTPRGTSIKFDLSELYAETPSPTGPITED